MFNLAKCAVSECGNTVGVDLEVIRLEEAERGWMGGMWIDMGTYLCPRIQGSGKDTWSWSLYAAAISSSSLVIMKVYSE